MRKPNKKPNEIVIKGKTLTQILIDHEQWLCDDYKSYRGMRADLSGADLRSINLRNADLYVADLQDADLSAADLRDADLSAADLSGINLSNADLRNADLSGANANLSGADTQGANLFGADLCGADLRDANLCGTNLRNANLCGANLRGVNLCGADLYNTNLDNSEKIRKGTILKEPMIGWKKCKKNVIVKLEIPRGSIVFSINNSNCRTNKARVVEIIGSNRAFSIHKYFSYYVGDEIEIFNFNCEYNVECAEGIHFFRTREEAENY